MERKNFFQYSAYLLFFIFVVHFIATKLYWYYSLWWFDMPMHFLSGFWLGLVGIYFLRPQFSSIISVLKILLLVFLVGVGWEVFEFLFNNYLAQNPFDILDTLSDIFFDLAGGLLAIFFYFRKVMPAPDNTI